MQLFCCSRNVPSSPLTLLTFNTRTKIQRRSGQSGIIQHGPRPSFFLVVQEGPRDWSSYAGPFFSLCHDERLQSSHAIVLVRCGLTGGLRRATRAELLCSCWWVYFRMRQSRAKVRHSSQTQGDWPEERTTCTMRTNRLLMAIIHLDLIKRSQRTSFFAFRATKSVRLAGSGSDGFGHRPLTGHCIISERAILQNFSNVFAEQFMCGAAQTRIVPMKLIINFGAQTKNSAKALTYQNKWRDGSSHAANGRVSLLFCWKRAV